MMSSRSTPGLMSARSTASNASRSSRMSQKRREKLLDIQRRAQLQDTLKEKLLATYGHEFKEQDKARRVIAEEVSKVISGSVISHIDIENMQAAVARRAKITGRRGSALPSARSRRPGSSAGRAAGRSIVGSAKFTPRQMSVAMGKSASTQALGRRAGAPPSARSTYSRRSSKLRHMGQRSMGGTSSRRRSMRRSVDGGSSVLPSINGRASGPATDAAEVQRLAEQIAAQVEKEKWKHTGGRAYGNFAAENDLEILPQKAKRMGPEDRATVEWTLLSELDTVKYEEGEQEKIDRAKKERMENQAFLAKQREDKKKKEAREREIELEWARRTIEQVKQAELEEQKKEQARKRKEAADRREFDKILQTAINAKQEALALEKKQDEAYAARAAAAVAREKELEEEKAAADKLRFQSFLRHNEAEQKKKEALRAKEAEEDYQRMLDSIAHAEKQEQARRDAFRLFEEKTKRKFEMSLDTKKKERERIALENRRIEEADAKFKRLEAEKAKAIADKKAADKAETLRVLALQIEEKNRVREAARQQGLRERDEVLARVARQEKEEEEKQRAKRNFNMRNRREVERQIRNNAKQPADPYFHMNDTERLINIRKLQEAQEHVSGRRSQYSGRASRRGGSSVRSGAW